MRTVFGALRHAVSRHSSDVRMPSAAACLTVSQTDGDCSLGTTTPRSPAVRPPIFQVVKYVGAPKKPEAGRGSQHGQPALVGPEADGRGGHAGEPGDLGRGQEIFRLLIHR